jgi:hypothetical protein
VTKSNKWGTEDPLKQTSLIYLTTSTIKDYRLKKLKKQYYKCEICGIDLKLDSEHNKTNVHLDHEHSDNGGSGCIRGVLCRRCNSILGATEGNWRHKFPRDELPNILEKMARYIRKYRRHQSNVVHPKERSKKGTK